MEKDGSHVRAALRRCAAVGCLLSCACVGVPGVEQRSATETDGAWVATGRWDAAEEDLFAQWVEILGRARAGGACSTFQSCLRNSEANLLFDEDDGDLRLFADCADLPYIARAYFSYKRRLPFSFVGAISGGRYTSDNRVLARRSHLDYSSLSALTRGLSETVHSGFFRTAPAIDVRARRPAGPHRGRWA
ncbi:MAG: hypothetical protein HYY06_19250 [Deltaproteobacteria bacterium]|nr:hypothetical protein [Deltaproteobacteria bacterium]